VLSTVLPGIILHVPPAPYDSPHLEPLAESTVEADQD
jgi:hypothetical protein